MNQQRPHPMYAAVAMGVMWMDREGVSCGPAVSVVLCRNRWWEEETLSGEYNTDGPPQLTLHRLHRGVGGGNSGGSSYGRSGRPPPHWPKL